MAQDLRRIVTPVWLEGHTHSRDGDRMKAVIGQNGWAGYGVTMPNLQLSVQGGTTKHVTTVAEALAYRERLMQAIPEGMDYTPLVTTSLTSDVTKAQFADVMACDDILAVKFYAGHTTNASGVDDVTVFGWAFGMLEKAGKRLLIHGEAGRTVDVFDREKRFYDKPGRWIVEEFSSLRVSAEHATTKELMQFVWDARHGVVATMTPQHLLSSRNDMLGMYGLRGNLYCMPILKREEDRLALLEAATSGNPKFFLGTDSAPHPAHGEPGKAKYEDCGCAGSYTAYHAVSLYTEAFAQAGKLHHLEAFASRNGHKFYGLTPKPGHLIIEEVEPEVHPKSFPFGGSDVVEPYYPTPDRKLRWRWQRTAD